MKKLLIICLLAFVAHASIAQDAIPEFKNKVMLATKDQGLTNLDMTTLSRGSKGKMGKGSIFLKAEGEHASVLNNAATANDFIIKIEPEVDPESIVTCYIFEIDNKSRILVTGEVTRSGSKDVTIPTVKLNFKKVQDGVYRISPAKPLVTGEYIFTVSQPLSLTLALELKGFAFSVQ